MTASKQMSRRSARARSLRRRATGARTGAVSTGTVAARAVGHLIDLGAGAGIRRDIMLDAAGVSDEDLHNPDARVPLAAEIALWQTLARHISDPEYGVRAGGTLSLRTMGLVGYVARFSDTLRGALRRVQRYGQMFTEAVELRLQGDRVALVSAHPALGGGHALAESYRLAAVLHTARDLTGVDVIPAEVAFTYAQPPMTTAHRQFFRCAVHFAARTASIRFRTVDLELPVAGADETLAGYLSNYAEQVLATLLKGETTRHKVRAAIWSLLGDGSPSLKHVAGALHMPPRTLQRRLAAEGTSLHQESEEVRKSMAIAALRDRSMMIEDVAFLLGYSEPSAFFRSFKRWTGTTPRQFREAM